jgi:hypothetical protein
MSKLIKNKCEVEGCDITENLHLHHIIERTDPNTSNHPYNLFITCPNHHAQIHSGRLKIIGVFPATKPPNNRIVVYELDGERNIKEDISGPPLQIKPKSFKIFEE